MPMPPYSSRLLAVRPNVQQKGRVTKMGRRYQRARCGMKKGEPRPGHLHWAINYQGPPTPATPSDSTPSQPHRQRNAMQRDATLSPPPVQLPPSRRAQSASAPAPAPHLSSCARPPKIFWINRQRTRPSGAALGPRDLLLSNPTRPALSHAARKHAGSMSQRKGPGNREREGGRVVAVCDHPRAGSNLRALLPCLPACPPARLLCVAGRALLHAARNGGCWC